jgi:rhomboid family GlyGly-CTERM serine protease
MTSMSHTALHHLTRRLPCVSLLLAGVAVLIAGLPAGAVLLQYDRLAIASGELWRLCTSHWTHVSGDHLFWDVLLFVVLGTRCEQHSRREFVACVAAAAVLIPAGLWLVLPHLQTYRGLSGIDSALFALLAVTHLRQALRERRSGRVSALATVCLAFVAKVSFEVATGATLFVNSQTGHMLPVPLAHSIGAVVGLVVGWIRSTPRPVLQTLAQEATTGSVA